MGRRSFEQWAATLIDICQTRKVQSLANDYFGGAKLRPEALLLQLQGASAFSIRRILKF